MSVKRRKGWGSTRKKPKFQGKTGQPRKPAPVTIKHVEPRRRTA